MEIQNLTKYAHYISEKAGLELVEWENAWASYATQGLSCHIEDMWVHPEYRKSGLGSKLANYISSIARERGCKHLFTAVVTNSNDQEGALLAQIAYGLKIYKTTSEKIYLRKEI